MEYYDPNRACPKCQSIDVTTVYREKAKPGDISFNEEIGRSEHFLRGCRRCQYRWIELLYPEMPRAYEEFTTEEVPGNIEGTTLLIPTSSEKVMKTLSKRVIATKEAVSFLTENLKDYKTEMFDYIYTIFPHLKDYVVNFNHDSFKVTVVRKKPE